MPILRHWAAKPFELDRARQYPPPAGFDPYFKPRGLWFDVNSDWKRWCKAERFRPESLAVRYEVRIARAANVLRLSTSAELDQFTERYEVELPIPVVRPGFCINWPRVAAEYAGIIIAPYCWERRMDLMWYYSWDCASGCVWDLAAIAGWRLAE